MEIDGRRIRVDFSITQRAHTPTPGIYMGKPTHLHDRGWDGPRRREWVPFARNGAIIKTIQFRNCYSSLIVVVIEAVTDALLARTTVAVVHATTDQDHALIHHVSLLFVLSHNPI